MKLHVPASSSLSPARQSTVSCLRGFPLTRVRCAALGSSDVNKAAFAAASTKGILCMAFGGLSNILGTVFYNKAIARGSATAVTGLSACYPAVTLLLAAMLVGYARLASFLAFIRSSSSSRLRLASKRTTLANQRYITWHGGRRDKINKAKILGVLLAAGSGVAFSQA
jgi:drug/metabolite transporter (DMT)-like permease